MTGNQHTRAMTRTRHRDPRLGQRGAIVGALVAALGIWSAQSAAAHGLDDSAADEGTWAFLPLGIEHMLLGYDHLLFIGGVVLLAGEARRAAKFISLFALGHSTTLILATLAEWRLNATAVDVVIALSVVFVGVVGIRGRPTDWRPFGLAVLGFGLIHGMGLSTRLQDLGLPEEGLLGRVIAFNVGIEIGQLLAIAVLASAGVLISTYERGQKLERPAYAGLAIAGVVVAALLPVTSDDSGGPAVASATGTCTVEEESQPMVLTGGHPPKSFYGPTESAPEGDFGHVVGDGFVIVRYRPTVTSAQIAELQRFVEQGEYVVGGPQKDAPVAIRAITQERTLTCTDFDLTALEDFSAHWLEELTGQP